MGGLLIADTLLAIIRTRANASAPIWPNIVACIAFDTPYLGLHPHVFKNSATKAIGVAQSAHKAVTSAWNTYNAIGKPKAGGLAQPAGLLTAPAGNSTTGSAWSRWAPAAAYAVGGALVAGAAAGTAVYKRSEIQSGYTYFQDHMKYAGNLWDKTALQERVDNLLQAEQAHDVLFRNFYTAIPPDLTTFNTTRTFIILPESDPAATRFTEARNTLAEDEVHAHIGMFEPSTNDDYYQLGLAVARIIQDALAKHKTLLQGGGVHKQDITGKSGGGYPVPEKGSERASSQSDYGLPHEDNPWR